MRACIELTEDIGTLAIMLGLYPEFLHPHTLKDAVQTAKYDLHDGFFPGQSRKHAP